MHIPKGIKQLANQILSNSNVCLLYMYLIMHLLSQPCLIVCLNMKCVTMSCPQEIPKSLCVLSLTSATQSLDIP